MSPGPKGARRSRGALFPCLPPRQAPDRRSGPRWRRGFPSLPARAGPDLSADSLRRAAGSGRRRGPTMPDLPATAPRACRQAAGRRRTCPGSPGREPAPRKSGPPGLRRGGGRLPGEAGSKAAGRTPGPVGAGSAGHRRRAPARLREATPARRRRFNPLQAAGSPISRRTISPRTVRLSGPEIPQLAPLDVVALNLRTCRVFV